MSIERGFLSPGVSQTLLCKQLGCLWSFSRSGKNDSFGAVMVGFGMEYRLQLRSLAREASGLGWKRMNL